MKKFIRFLVPILLVVAILGSLAWYLFVYDRGFTQEMLLRTARHFEISGKHDTAAWFYDLAYKQSGNDEDVAIEMAERFKAIGNYTKAEYTLSNAIAKGGTVDLYIALCRTYVQQDKLLDAVEMLDKISNPQIKEELNALRPAAPTSDLAPGFYNQYYEVHVTAPEGTLFMTSDGEYPSTSRGMHHGTVTLPGGETTLKAVAVNDDGLVSPVSIFGYIVGGVIEEVHFEDEAMEQAIRQILNTGENTVLYSDDLWDITEFTVPEETETYTDLRYLPYLTSLTINDGSFEDVKFLTQMQDLETLSISGTNLTSENLETIAALPRLNNLILSGCGLSNISALGAAQSLVHLNLADNTIRDIDVLSGLVSLESIDLQHNALTSLNALSVLTGLKELNVSYNSLTSIAPVCTLPALAELNVSNNSLSDLGAVNNLSNLARFYAGTNAIVNVNSLAGCTGLAELDLSNNQISDISALSVLTGLTDFNFSNNTVSALPQWPSDCALTTIDGSYNALTDLEALRDMENLNRVTMDYNPELADISCLSDCPVLIQVSVFGTQVREVSSLTDNEIIVSYDPTSLEEAQAESGESAEGEESSDEE